jgi:competence protein ComEC
VSRTNRLHQFPALRPLLAFAVGIAGGDALFFHASHLPLIPLLIASSLLAVFLCVFVYIFGKNRSVTVGVAIFSCFLLGGAALSVLRLERTRVSWKSDAEIYRAWVVDAPSERPKTIRCRSQIGDRTVLLYLPKDSLSATVRRGDELSFRAVITPPTDIDSTDAFDYARYLHRQGISGTGFVPRGRWLIESYRTQSNWQQTAFDARERILALYRRLPFNDDERALLSALTVGYKTDLSPDVRESFSVSGVSHVLAVSGMHVGLIYGLILLLFGGVSSGSRFSLILQTLVSLLLLWIFAFITGLSPSVVRAALMFSLLALSRLVSGRTIAFNTLCVAALGMLAFRPLWLFDVGFQLSFTAVSAILFLQPRLGRLWLPKRPIIRYVWSICTVSVAAQIGVTPLILFYFGRFSTHFLVTNVLVVPLVALTVYAAVVLLATSPIAFLCTGVAWLVKGLLASLLWIVRGIERLPYASIDEVPFTMTGVCLCYSALILLCWFLERHSYDTRRSS